MKTQRRTKSSQKGGECGNLTITGELAPGIPIYGLFEGANCNQNGGYKKKQSRSKKAGKAKKVVKGKKSQKKKVDEKKVDQIIDRLCKSIKRKCTPKYKKLLKKIVIKNM